jgi:hypothetical protein
MNCQGLAREQAMSPQQIVLAVFGTGLVLLLGEVTWWRAHDGDRPASDEH